MRKFVCAAVVVLCAVTIAMAEDIRAVITKIEDGKVTFKAAPKQKGGEFGAEQTVPLATTAKIYKGKFNRETKKLEADKDNALDTATATTMVSKAKKGAFGVVTVEGGKVTQIIMFGKGGKKKKTD